MKLLYFCVFCISSLLLLYKVVSSETMELKSPPFEPENSETILLCEDVKFQSLQVILNQMLANPPYRNFEIEKRICSLHYDYGYVVRVHGTLFEPELKMERKEYLILWKNDKGKVITLSDHGGWDKKPENP